MAKYLPSSMYWVLSIEAQIVPLPPSDFASRVQTMSQPLTTSCLLCNINCSLSFFVVTCKTICHITWETCFLSVFSLAGAKPHSYHIHLKTCFLPVFLSCAKLFVCHIKNLSIYKLFLKCYLPVHVKAILLFSYSQQLKCGGVLQFLFMKKKSFNS